MQQRDFIKDQIEQAGRVVSNVLARAIGIGPVPDINIVIIHAQKQFKEELDIDLDLLLKLKPEEIPEYLESKQFPIEQYEKLAEYFAEIGTRFHGLEDSIASKYLKTALTIMERVDDFTQVFSMEKLAKKNRIKELLEI